MKLLKMMAMGLLEIKCYKRAKVIYSDNVKSKRNKNILLHENYNIIFKCSLLD